VVVILAGLGMLLGTSVCSHASYPSPLPQMTGSAQAPKTVKPSVQIAYVLTQTDKDTNFVNQQFIDEKCAISPWVIRSMVPYSWTFSLRGVDGMGVHTWDITGTSVSTLSPYVDEWILYNQRVDGDIYKDTQLQVNQNITVSND